MPQIETPSEDSAPSQGAGSPSPGGRSADEIALELMKFIAVTTGYGKSTQTSAGFSGKPGGRSPEEQTDALLELFDRCRRAVKKEN
ncbi:MAG: hypothetical protein KGN84_09610 [Acidobacteriota bacterium]|nr:hypothetical protein [Acidobacteriota bacterium]